MWKFLYESVAGTSHADAGTSCQDASYASRLAIGGEDAIVLVCADGAGSASNAQEGARLACNEIMRWASRFYESGLPLTDLDEATLRQWVRGTHESIKALAEGNGKTARDYACTLVLAVLGQSTSTFAQLGDGAIVVSQGGALRAVVWPQSGEYQNTTYFITDEQYETHLQIRVGDSRVDDIALFTDGIQMLALNYAQKIPHEPFFKPLFRSLRSTSEWQELGIELHKLLDSPSINGRTDDDKTLILASWVESAESTA